MWHFIADMHLDHGNIIKYCHRPFLSDTEQGLMNMIDKGLVPQRELRISQQSINNMTDTILDSVNATVQRSDTLVIGGDFCFTTRENRDRRAKELRNRINCENVYLIWGNHDDRRALDEKDVQTFPDRTVTTVYDNKKLFKGCYDQYMFKVDGEHIFMSHYPCRSWDGKPYDSWMLYGHVHNLFWYEDNGQLSPSTKNILGTDFAQVLKNHNIEDQSILDDLLAAVADQYGGDLTVDIGVDNVRPGVPFGTPWSMDDLRTHMKQKKAKRDARQARIRAFRPLSQCKGAERN